MENGTGKNLAQINTRVGINLSFEGSMVHLHFFP
jgi:hypothetical protein